MSDREHTAVIAVIGTELVTGQARDHNSEYIADWLRTLGYETRYVIKLPDDIEVIAIEIRNALDQADIIILTGGLGSTHDDITREALARVFRKQLVLDEEMSERIMRRAPDGADRDAFIRQALKPEGSRWLGQTEGVAPSMAISLGEKMLYSLPGVPSEMRGMLEHVAEDMRAHFSQPHGLLLRKLKLVGLTEPAAANLIEPVIQACKETTFNILTQPQDIKITLIGKDTEDGRKQMTAAVDRLTMFLGDHVYARDDETLSGVVGKLLKKNKESLAVGESITAGLIASEITATSGSSQYFLGGIVAYDNSAKVKLLNVSPETLARTGAVSRETALEMASGAREAFGSDIGLSVTGIAGPTGGTPQKDIGLVYAGLSTSTTQAWREFQFRGNRREVQLKTAYAAINMLRLHLMGSG